MFLKRRMKSLRIPRSMSVVRSGRAKLAVIAAGLVALGAYSAVPAAARHAAAGDRPDPQQSGSDPQQSGSDPQQFGSGPVNHGFPGDPVVNFRRNAIFTCFGADGTGIPTANAANITASPTTVTAVVTVHAPPFTSVFGELTQSGCTRLKFFSFTVGASGVGTTTVTDFRIAPDAFVSFSDTAGDFQITPEVIF
jgi:hypothetical protein